MSFDFNEIQDFIVSLQECQGGDLISQIKYENTYYDDVLQMILNDELENEQWGWATIWAQNERGDFLLDLTNIINDGNEIYESEY